MESLAADYDRSNFAAKAIAISLPELKTMILSAGLCNWFLSDFVKGYNNSTIQDRSFILILQMTAKIYTYEWPIL